MNRICKTKTYTVAEERNNQLQVSASSLFSA